VCPSVRVNKKDRRFEDFFCRRGVALTHDLTVKHGLFAGPTTLAGADREQKVANAIGN
jgi:hypothetical protein